MTDIADSKRRSKLMARIGGCDTVIELAIRRIAHRMGLRFRLYGDGPLDTSVLPFRLAYNRLLHPDTNDNELNSGRCSRGANFTNSTVRGPCHADGGGSGGASVGFSCEGSGPILMSEECRYTAGLGEQVSKLDTRWYFHGQ